MLSSINDHKKRILMKKLSAELTTLRQRLAVNDPALVGSSKTSTMSPNDELVYPEAAVLVAIAVDGDELSVLLTRRAGHLNLHPGEAAFPGGKRDPGDGTLLATALREANEEVGLHAGDFEYLGRLDQHLTRSNIKVAPYVVVLARDVVLVPSLDELDCIYKIPLSFFAKHENMQLDSADYQGIMKRVPRFDVSTSEHGDHSIWGVTALIIVDLMNTVFDAGLQLPDNTHR